MAKAKNSTVFVDRTIRNGKEAVEEEGDEGIIAVHRFETEPANVSVDYSLTMNLGNFESARISVSVQIPCYREEIDDAYEFASAWVEQRIGEERNKIVGEPGKKGSPL
jgi:hypothetical protein